MNEIPTRYRLRVYGSRYVGGMKVGDRYGRISDPSLAVTFNDRASADAAAIRYDAWVEPVDQPITVRTTRITKDSLL